MSAQRNMRRIIPITWLLSRDFKLQVHGFPILTNRVTRFENIISYYKMERPFNHRMFTEVALSAAKINTVVAKIKHF